jgi:hypothetical protein
MLDLLTTLGQGKQLTDEDRASILFWSGVLIGLGIVIAVAGYVIYRRLKKAGERDPEATDAGFSLSEMRRLYEAGEMSHEEYVQVRDRVIAATKKSMLGDAAMSHVRAVDPAPAPPAPPPGLPPVIDTTPEVIDPDDDAKGET